MTVKMLRNAYQPIMRKLDVKTKEFYDKPDILTYPLYAGNVYGVSDEFGEFLISIKAAKKL